MTAGDYLPTRRTLPALEQAARGCQGCNLYRNATQTVLVCLGATAAQQLLGRDFRITKQRGEFLATDWAPWTLATYHPSALLRAPDEYRDAMRADFAADLRLVAEKLATL